MTELWRGGLPGGNFRPTPYGGMFGPSVIVVADEDGLHAALGEYLTNRQPMTILVVATIVATRPFVFEEGVGLSIIGLGNQTIYVDFEVAGHRALFDITGSATSITVADLTIGTQAGSNLPTSVFYLSAVSDLAIRNITQRGSTAPASTYFVNSNINVTEGRIAGCTSSLDIQLTANRCLLWGNKIGDVTISGAFTGDNSLFGNHMGDGDDSGSSGGNSAVGNVGGGSFAAWTGAGSVATGNA